MNRKIVSTITVLLTAVFLPVIIYARAEPLPVDTRDPVSGMNISDIQISIDEVVASGFLNPIQVTHAGDGSLRLFVVEQEGLIRIIQNGTTLPTPFLDISDKIICCGERGLLGLAFHPDYASNGYFYLNYSRTPDGDTVIARYTVSNSDPNLADANSENILLIVDQPYSNHNGGQLLFSPVDGYLYIGMGDGGSGGDPLNHAQNINTLLGAMLRLDVDSAFPYAIPPGNPFVGSDGLDEIWSYGLRNPWRFSFDRSNGDLYIGDVGQNAWEEIDYQQAGTPGGINFGWRCKEGTHDYNFSGDCLTADLTDPIAEYSHNDGRAVTGGFIYRGQDFPNLVGLYFYADYVSGNIWSLYKTGSNPDTWSVPVLELSSGLLISAFGEDENGEIYVVDRGGGTIRRLVDLNNPPEIDLSNSSKESSTPYADPGEVVTYTLTVRNIGEQVAWSATIIDTLPEGLEYLPGSLQASHGSVDDDSAPTLVWNGISINSQEVTIQYQATVAQGASGSLINQAILSSPPDNELTLAHSLDVPRPGLATTPEDFKFPGTQPETIDDPIPAPEDCDTCHSEPIYDRWRGSMMSQAGNDPLMWAALHIANNDAPNAGEYCLRCHTPKGWLEGHSQDPDGSQLTPDDLRSGVACEVCHRMVDPQPSTQQDETTAIDQVIRDSQALPIPDGFTGSGAIIIDPNDNRRGPFSFEPPLPYHSAYQTDFFNQTSQAVTRSRLCGSCHNVYNPVLSWDDSREQYWPNEMDAIAPEFDSEALFPIETTFDEWLYSDFARSGVYAPQFAGEMQDGIVRACQDCHMTRATGTAADAAFNPVERDCQTTGCLPVHEFVGGNTWVPGLLKDPLWRLQVTGQDALLDATMQSATNMLRKAATLTVTLEGNQAGKTATVRVTNHSGHKLPTGYPEGRQIWIHLQAFDENNNLIYESGAYDFQTGVLDRSGAKVYEVKQGITPELAAILPQDAGESFHFVLNNTTLKDNRIPPKGYSQALYNKPGLRPVNADYEDGQYWDDTVYHLPGNTARVAVKLYYQTASKEYIDFLKSNGGLDGQVLGAMWEKSKSPPVVMAQAWEPSYETFLPVISQSQ